MTTVTAKIQDSYFDRQKVIQKIGRENARRLGRAGAFVQRRAKSLLGNPSKYRKRAKPRARNVPRVHSKNKQRSLRNIRFGLSPDSESVLIGPLALSDRKPKGSRARTVPELLSLGGSARVEQYSNGGDWQLGIAPQAAHHRTIAAHYQPQPFMGPALDMEIAAGTIDNVWSK